MIVFDKELSIADNINNSTKVIATAEIVIEPKNKVVASVDDTINYLKPKILTKDSIWFPAILVTTNWNKNDDVFSPAETAKAWETPLLKPVNWQHKGDEKNNLTLGVINAVLPVSDSYEILDSSYDSLSKRDKFHLAIGNLIWSKYFPEKSDTIKTYLEKGVLYVSMECHIDNFGYAIKPLKPTENQNDDAYLLDRTPDTAGLTSYLRVFGGPGVVELGGVKYRIGRWLKDIIFTGVGCVYKPANLESVTLLDQAVTGGKDYFIAASEKIYKDAQNCVSYQIENENKVETMSKETKVEASDCMDMKEVEAMKKEMAELKATIEASNKVKAEAEAKAAADAKAVAEKLEAAEKEIASYKKEMAEVAAALTAKASEVEAMKKMYDETKAALAAINLAAEAKARMEELKAFAYDLSEDEAKAMSPETFDAVKAVAQKVFAAANAKKSTENTGTNLPKSTDDTQTNLKKATEAMASADVKGSAVDLTKADNRPDDIIKRMSEILLNNKNSKANTVKKS